MMTKSQRILNLTFFLTIIISLFFLFSSSFLHSVNLLTDNNYLLGPIGDDAYDSALVTYPIFEGKKFFGKILQPFADHRVVTERLFAAFDFYVTQGKQAIQHYKIFIYFVLTLLLFGYILTKTEKLLLREKIISITIATALLFSSSTLINYLSTMLFTWPQILLYSLCSFYFINKYCNDEAKDNRIAMYYFYLTTLFVYLAIYTFNIGLILWPIVFYTLYRERCFNRLIPWLVVALSSYALYFSKVYTPHRISWQPHTFSEGIHFFISHPDQVFFYFSRIVSLPFIPSAKLTHSWLTCLFGICELLISTFLIIFFIRKKNWKNFDSIFFSGLVFSLGALILISISRAGVAAEYVSIGLRFTTPNFFLIMFILPSSFLFLSDKSFCKLFFTSFVVSLFAYFFLVGDAKFGNGFLYVSDINRDFFITQSTGIPANSYFIELTKYANNEYDPAHLAFLSEIQQKRQKSAYSLWPSQYLNTNLLNHFSDIQHFSHAQLTLLTTPQDNFNYAARINVTLSSLEILGKHDDWFLLLTDSQQRIMGFGIPTPIYKNYANFFIFSPKIMTWKGVINLMNSKDKFVHVYLASKKERRAYDLGSLDIITV